MKLLNSLLFSIFCLLSDVNAAEPLVSPLTAHTTAPINGSVETSRNDITQADAYIKRMNDLKFLKISTLLCTAMWVAQLVTCYSECGQSEYLNQGAGILAAGTFELALNYFKLNWLTPELTISSIPPYVALFVVTALSIVVNTYDLPCVAVPMATSAVGLWFSLFVDFLNQRDR